MPRGAFLRPSDGAASGFELTESIVPTRRPRLPVLRNRREHSLIAIADGNGPTPSAFGQLKAEEFRFDFGFISLHGWSGGALPLDSTVRAAWLEISDQKLYDMAFALEDQDSNPVKFFAELHVALNARSMAFGMETSALQFYKFFNGLLPVEEVDQHISTAIAPPAESAAAMRRSPWLREVDVNGVQVLTRYLSGLDEYFPKPGT